jgi:hypothetical protein
VLLRGLIHVLALASLALVAMAFGRWLSDPAGVMHFFVLMVSAAVVAACLARLYGPAGPIALRRPRAAPVERPAPPAPPAHLWAPPLVDLNRASRAELLSLPGVGPVVAARIEAARPFASVDDLARVPGFGPARRRALADRVKI